MNWPAIPACAAAALWLGVELAHGLAAGFSGRGVRGGEEETLLVLGCPPLRDGRPSALQRWRVELAARNAGPRTRWVFSGAGEAEVMARHAIERFGVDPASVVCENRATTTWENIGYAAELIPPDGVVRVVSDPLHARRGVRYWRKRWPQRAGELRPARLYRFGEHPLLKLTTAAYALVLRGLRYRPDGRIWQRVSAAR
ncbi:MAG: YdcF family protein [Micropruina sp.]|uniref:YdcF family protein n=1 Tax=Micropruina sp. TaxID=2737536 RepID=UPI0039E27538